MSETPSVQHAVETLATDYCLRFLLFWTVFYVLASVVHIHSGGEHSLDAVMTLWSLGGLGAATATVAYISEYHYGYGGFLLVLGGVVGVTAIVV